MRTIAVVGSINMDLIVTAERIPQKGETLKGKNLQYLPGGKGANQAVAAAKLGGQVEMFGCVGKDDFGKQLLENLDTAGVGISHIRVVDDVSSGAAFVTVGSNDNTIVIIPGANDCVDKAYIDSVKDDLLQADVIVLQQEIPQETNEYVAKLGQEHGKTVILNPAPAKALSPELLEWVNYLTPNEHEAALIFGNKLSLEDMMYQHPGKLIVTQGALGVSMCRLDGELMRFPAVDVQVVDTTGAGDTLNGAFAFMMARQSTMEEALEFANYAAGCSVEKHGAQSGMPCYQQVIAKRQHNC